jgi:hypothetical protein
LSGWGSSGYGNSPWGGFLPPTNLEIISALAISENVIQLGFSAPVYFSGVLDQPDASNPSRFSISVVANTTGLDGNLVRPVSVVSVVQEIAQAQGGDLPLGAAAGTYLDIILDRPMTPYPAQYTIVANGLYSADFSLSLDPASATNTLYGLYRQIIPPTTQLPTPTRDFSNPQSLIGAITLKNPGNLANLGVFPLDASNDYAIDQGMQSYKKRVFRRLMSKPGAFVHLGEKYGVGIPQQGKRLATAQVQQRITSQSEKQIAQEPETDKVVVKLQPNPTNNGVTQLIILIQVKGSPPQKWVTDLPTQT